jgi:sigma-B regulation protein RsbU (phosphoserine phosphatase)
LLDRHDCVLQRRLGTSCDEAGRELEAVAAAQQLLLPAELPAVPGLDLAVSYRPARQAGGDYYDFVPLVDGRWGLFIADVSGHGAAAAIVAAVVHATLHSCQELDDPGRTLAYINRRLRGARTEWSGSFVTAFYAVFDPHSRTLSYATAGHPPARLRSGSDGVVRPLDVVRALPLGIEAAETFVTNSTIVTPGDVLVMFTDGVPEASDLRDGWFGTERLDRSIARASGSAAAVLDVISKDLVNFTEGQRPGDDQTLVVGVLR